MADLHIVPRFDDSLTYLYAEHVRVDRHANSIGLWDADGITEVPVAALRVFMLGPGTSVTHGAIKVLADNNCLVVWCGEEAVRLYACGLGGTRSAARLVDQARLVSDPQARLQVVRRMYAKRLGEIPPADATIEQIRGMEGQRVRETYQRLSRDTGVPWERRSYDRGEWSRADPINRAISAANSCLYGLCHAAILSAGYSPALGFIHTGKQLSFVYDIADVYKTELSLRVAFEVTAKAPPKLERHVRLAMRDAFRSSKLLSRIIPDIRELLADETSEEELEAYQGDPARPSELWSPTQALGRDGGR
jgi:CRISPR-associated protein Cas1